MSTEKKLTLIAGIIQAWHDSDGGEGGADGLAIQAIRDVLNPEPLTRERARAWAMEEDARLALLLLSEMTDADYLRREALHSAIVEGTMAAIVDMLVDAAAGRIQ